MKPMIFVSMTAMALSLAGCGLRGDLERPAPLWGVAGENDPPPADIKKQDTEDEFDLRRDSDVDEDEEALLRQRQEPERLAGTSYVDPQTGATYWAQNEGGGVKPLPSPVKQVEVTELPPVSE